MINNMRINVMKFISICCMAILMILAVACGFNNENTSSKDNKLKSADDASLSLDERADIIVNNMTQSEKVGQLMMIGIQGTEVNENSLYMLHEYHIGGIVFFDRNLKDKAQVQKLTDDLQSQSQQKLPLFIGIDEEGGDVVRMKQEITPPPSQKEVGNSGNLQKAEELATGTAKQLKELGINLNFAPVADVGSPDERSFSSDAQVVSKFVLSAAKGYEQENMIYSLKHFPGIGKGKVDTHIDSYSVDADKNELEKEDLLPFKTAVNQLAPENYMIMVSHLTYSALDKDTPASLSKNIINNILRQELNYEGVIITDDMEMGAISKYYSFDEVGVKAILAGADMVMVCHDYEHEKAVYNGLLKAVQSGKISEERLNQSVHRILKMKLANKKMNTDKL